MDPLILVQFDPPPIPLRQFDWSAWREGTEEEGPIGYGTSEDEARADLAEQLESERGDFAP